VVLFCGWLPIGTVAQQAAAVPALVLVRPIEPPDRPLPAESASAAVTRFSFIAYGDTRCACDLYQSSEVQRDHSQVVDAMLKKIRALAATAFPVRFVLQSGDAVWRGQNGERWNDGFTPIIEKLTRQANVPYFFAVGNHDVTGMPAGDPGRELGLHNTLTAMSKLIPPEGSSRRLAGYPTYAFGFGNVFAIALDSNIASDPIQLAWVSDQLAHLDHTRYRHIVAFFHHPAFSSGPHGGAPAESAVALAQKPPYAVEPPTASIRSLYMPLFRKHHVRLMITGHDHLFDHWVERYTEGGTTYRVDELLTGGGGAPIYTYRGEPDLRAYLAAGVQQAVRVEHLTKPGPTPADNPNHFVVIRVDGDRLSVEVVGVGVGSYKPYGPGMRSILDLTN
jgi:hypothetical protein